MSENTLSTFARLFWSALAGACAPNLRLSRVTRYHPPGPLVAPDGSSLPWPASVDVQPLTDYLLQPESAARLRSGERMKTANLAQGTWPEAHRIPVMFFGDERLALVSPPVVGSVGLLLLAGTHFAVSPAIGESVAVLPPSTARASDAVFIPGFVLGQAAAILPESVAPSASAAPTLAPRGAEAEVCHLTREGTSWTIAGTQVRLGGPTASTPVSGVGDNVDAGPALVTFAANVVAALTALGQPIAPLAPVGVGTISSGSSVVKRT